MISIGRYIRGNQGVSGGPATDDTGSQLLAGLYSCILDHIDFYVFTGEFSRFRVPLQQARLTPEAELSEAEAIRLGESVRAVLSSYNQTAQESLQNTAIEMQEMVGVLGQALTVLSGGSERSVSRLQKIQDTLQRTSAIQDVATLRASLRDVVQLIGEESSNEQQTLLRERDSMATQVVRFRELLAGNANRRLPGREEGIRGISDSLASVASGQTVWIIAFFFEQLKAIVQRYGPEVVDDLFLQLIRERLQPVAPASSAFRWSPSGIVGIARMEPDLTRLQNEMARLNRAPLVCRIALGSRTAVLKVALSHLVMEAKGPSLETLIGEIDGFTRFADAGTA